MGLGVLLVMLLAACTASVPDAAEDWPAPSLDRPVVDVAFDTAPDLASATGTETVRFTPDRQVCELVFRNWPNKPTAARAGSALEITSARVGDTVLAPQIAPDPTLVTLPLSACVPAGTAITADLTFRLTLGKDSGERVGYSPATGTAWFGTAFPLLAWVRGEGWVRDAAVDLYGETATSEDAALTLSVTAAEGQEVVATGTATGTTTPAPGRVTHQFTAEAVRDAAVSVGAYAVTTREVRGVRVHVATPRSGSRATGDEWIDELDLALERHGALLGAYPYPDLTATIVPTQTDGVEFPMALQFADDRRAEIPGLVAHELAHQWFYSLVGNDQARDPWLDEAFATWAQALATGQEDRYRLDRIPRGLRGRTGEPMEYWARTGDFTRYVRGVYDQGAAALLEARRRAGADRFDAAVRAYLQDNAHRVAGPAEVAAAFRDVPEALEALRDAGALPAG
ncbi:M1 family metallopeptidase [Pseudonocardia halophobica]|uniref:Metallopeptidase n=1 Tax=Pseudonocardia halophobica TaxID=29401 RepID=A0A9W6L421_9PSEU|nr:metallopeptidase [Pseudonocardia halophobica]